MQKKPVVQLAPLVILSVLISVMLLLSASAAEIDFNAFVQEIQKMSQNPNEMTLVWWVPAEYWQEALGRDPSSTPQQISEIINLLSPYTLFVIADGHVGSFGGVTYKTRAEIFKSLQLVDNQVNTYFPLEDNEINADAQNFLSMMKPVFANMLGQMGQNMHFFVFPSTSVDGKKIADAKSDSTFSVLLGQRTFRWKLPIGSLLLPKTCPKCGEQLNGAYKFCPWDGAQLH